MYPLLPILRGWTYIAKQQGPISVQPGKSIQVHIGTKPGWLVTGLGQFSGHADAKFGKLKIIIDNYKIEGTVYEIESSGVTSPIASQALWVSRYDTTNNVYALAFSPATPTPLAKEVSIEVIAPAVNPITKTAITSPTTIYAIFGLIEITSLDEFKESIKEALR